MTLMFEIAGGILLVLAVLDLLSGFLEWDPHEGKHNYIRPDLFPEPPPRPPRKRVREALLWLLGMFVFSGSMSVLAIFLHHIHHQ